jgi:hypothetical protein
MNKPLLLVALCALNFLCTSSQAQWSYVSGTSGPIYYTGGNVGIGINDPVWPLDVASGSIMARKGIYALTDSGGSITTYFKGPTSGTQSCNMVLQADNGGGNAFWITGATDYLKIGGAGGHEDSAAGPINVDYLGNVGINTLNTTGYKFNCAGSAVFDQVTVANFSGNNPKATPWADFVFDNAYRLTSLDSLSAFIKANKHLPGIPTAAEVKKNGIDLAATDAQLLEKIEQLTLYTIDQNKEIDQLHSANEKLQQQADDARTANEKLLQLVQAQGAHLASLQQQVDDLKKANRK